jgi:hypothetical protein
VCLCLHLCVKTRQQDASDWGGRAGGSVQETAAWPLQKTIPGLLDNCAVAADAGTGGESSRCL